MDHPKFERINLVPRRDVCTDNDDSENREDSCTLCHGALELIKLKLLMWECRIQADRYLFLCQLRISRKVVTFERPIKLIASLVVVGRSSKFLLQLFLHPSINRNASSSYVNMLVLYQLDSFSCSRRFLF